MSPRTYHIFKFNEVTLLLRSSKRSFVQSWSLYTSILSSAGVTSQAEDDAHDSLYNYTGGRWLWNEEKQLKARYVKFNLQALCDIAARAVGSGSCTNVRKIPEGNFNKALLLSMDDGKEVVAKIPNPNTGLPELVTSSEVATMDFVRNQLHIPVPKVFDWCSKAANTPVGAEFIIMEKVPGVQLSQVWDKMEGLKKAKLVEQLAQFDKRLCTNSFHKYGSLYYNADGNDLNNKFVVGPTTNRKYLDDGRGSLNIDRGPWKSIEDYLAANARREKDSIIQLGDSPRLQGLFNAPGLYQASKAAKFQALDSYMRVYKHILPRIESTHRPVLWHPDLHTNNIFVDAKDTTKITSIIDWQCVHIAPMFLQVRRPALLDFDGPIPESFKLPELPENFEQLSHQEQQDARKLRSAQKLYCLYEIELLLQCREAGNALRGRDTLLTRIHGLVGSLFHDGEPVVLGYLMEVVDRWSEIAGTDTEGNPLVECPIAFSEDERVRQKIDQEKWEEGIEILDSILQNLGAYIGWDGLVSHADYDTMKELMDQLREKFLEQVAETDQERQIWAKAWPFPVSR